MNISFPALEDSVYCGLRKVKSHITSRCSKLLECKNPQERYEIIKTRRFNCLGNHSIIDYSFDSIDIIIAIVY